MVCIFVGSEELYNFVGCIKCIEWIIIIKLVIIKEYFFSEIIVCLYFLLG